MIYQRYLYKAYLLELLFTDIEVIIDQDILSENKFKRMFLDGKNLSWYNLEKARQGDKNNESSQFFAPGVGIKRRTSHDFQEKSIETC